MIVSLAPARPHLLAASLCTGLAAANLGRTHVLPAAAAAAAVALFALVVDGPARVAALAVALAAAGWVWGSHRLDSLDRSVLTPRVGHVDHTVAEVTAPARRGQFGRRVIVTVRRFGSLVVDEPALLELPLGRAPPQGAVI